jgi:hypothetical protein
MTILAVLGTLISFSIWIGCLVANSAIDSLTLWWDENRPKDYQGPDIQGIRSGSHTFSFFMPGRMIRPYSQSRGSLC